MKRYYNTNMLTTQKLEDALLRTRSPEVRAAIETAISKIIEQDSRLCAIAKAQLSESAKLLLSQEGERE